MNSKGIASVFLLLISLMGVGVILAGVQATGILKRVVPLGREEEALERVTQLDEETLAKSGYDGPVLITVLREDGSFSFAKVENAVIEEDKFIGSAELLFQNGDYGLAERAEGTLNIFVSKKGKQEGVTILERAVIGVRLPDATVLPVKVNNGRIVRGHLAGDFQLLLLSEQKQINGRLNSRGKILSVAVVSSVKILDPSSAAISKELLKLSLNLEGEPEGVVLGASTDEEGKVLGVVSGIGSAVPVFAVSVNTADGSLTMEPSVPLPVGGPGPAGPAGVAGPAGPAGTLDDASVTTVKIADGAVTDSKIGTITGVNKVAGSAIELKTGGGLTTGSGLTLLTNCSASQVLAWDGSIWACSSAGGAEADTLATVVGRGATVSILIDLGGGLTVSGGTLTLPAGSVAISFLAAGDYSGKISGLTSSNLSATAGITNAQLFNSNFSLTADSGITGATSLGGTLNVIGGGINSVNVSGSTLTVTGSEADTLDAVVGRGLTTAFRPNLNGGFSAQGFTGNAMVVLDQLGGENILSASAAGATKFEIRSTGNVVGVGSLSGFTIDASNNTISGLTTSNLSTTAGITNSQLANSSFLLIGDSGPFGSVSLGGQLTASGSGIATTTISGSALTITATEADTLGSVASRGSTTTNRVALNGGLSSQAWTSNALVVLDQIGPENILSASAAGLTRFEIRSNGDIVSTGNASISGTLTLYTTPTVQSANNQTLILGGDTTGNIILSPKNNTGRIGINTSSPSPYSFVNLNLNGTTQTDAMGIRINGDFAGSSTAQYAILLDTRQVTNSNTSLVGLYSRIDTAAQAITLTNAYNLYLSNSIEGAGSTITNQYGIYIADLTSATNNYAIYVDGTTQSYFGGKVEIDGITRLNNIDYTWPSSQTANYVLSTNGSGTLSWSDPALLAGNAIYWNQGSGALFPKNSTVDLLIGGQSTASAKFAFLNVNSGTPTASISGSPGVYLTASGNLATTDMQSLTLGGSTTGFIVLDEYVGIGTTEPKERLQIGSAFTFDDAGPYFISFGYSPNPDIDLNSSEYAGEIKFDPVGGSLSFGVSSNVVNDPDTYLTLMSDGRFKITSLEPTLIFEEVAETTWQWLLGGDQMVLQRSGSDYFLVTNDQTVDVKGRIVNTDDTTFTIEALYDNLLFRTNGADRMIIDDAGRVGIRTTTPSIYSLVNIDLDAYTGAGVAGLQIDGDLAGSATAQYGISIQPRQTTNSSTSLTGLYSRVDTAAEAISLDNAYNIYIANSLVGAGSDIQNLYGVYIADLTSGDNDNWAIYAAGTTPSYFGGNVVIGGTTRFNNIAYIWPSSQTANYVLTTDGSGGLSWSDSAVLAGSAIYWNQANGAVFPKNSTADLLIGGQSTASAKFAFTNVDSGTPTASISGTNARALVLDAFGNITTTAMQSLTLGSASTGNIQLSPKGSTGLFVDGNGQVGINTTATTARLTIKSSGSASTVEAWVKAGSASLLGQIYDNGNNGDLLLNDSANNNYAQISKTGFSYINSTVGFGLGTITPNALLQVAGTASISGALTLYTTPTLQSTANQTLTLGGSTTGDISLAENVTVGGTFTFNAETFSDLTGNGLSLSSGALTVNLTTSGATGATSSNSGLEVSASGLTLLHGCADNEILKWTDAGGWACAADSTSAGAGVSTIQENDVTITSVATTLDFLGSDFTITETPSGEANVVIDYTNSGITRKAQAETVTGGWTFNTASTTFTTSVALNGGVTSTGNLSLQIAGTGTTGNVQIGDGAGSATPDLFVLDIKNTAGDPTGTNGAMYYNSNTGKFRCFENSAWINCVTTLADTQSAASYDTSDALTNVASAEVTLVSVSVTPTTATGDVYVRGKVQLVSSNNTDQSLVLSIEDNGTCTGATLATNTITIAVSAGTDVGDFELVALEVDAGATAQSYSLCASTATGDTDIRIYGMYATVIDNGSDLAEFYTTNDASLEAGDVVSYDSTLKTGVQKSLRAYEDGVVGIVSTWPGLAIGNVDREGTKAVPVALSGRVPVKVTTENGSIEAGDPLTSSSIPGVAMRATKAGTIIGMAMSGYDGEGVGLVSMFVKNGSTTGTRFDEILPGMVEGDVGRAILTELMTQPKEQASVNLSSVVTDRLVAGVEIVTPKLIAKEIEAEKIKGLEILTNRLASLDERLATVAGEKTDKAEPVENNFFKNLVEFIGRVIFKGDIWFVGRPTFNKDTAGFALVQAGASEVEIFFEREYATAPVVTASINVVGEVNPSDLPGYAVYDVGTRSFKIKLTRPTASDLMFSWIALAVEGARTSVGVGVVLPTPSATSTPVSIPPITSEESPSGPPSEEIVVMPTPEVATESGVID